MSEDLGLGEGALARDCSFGVSPARPQDISHDRGQGVTRLELPRRVDSSGVRRGHPLRPAAGIHPCRGDPLGRAVGDRIVDGCKSCWAGSGSKGANTSWRTETSSRSASTSDEGPIVSRGPEKSSEGWWLLRDGEVLVRPKSRDPVRQRPGDYSERPAMRVRWCFTTRALFIRSECDLRSTWRSWTEISSSWTSRSCRHGAWRFRGCGPEAFSRPRRVRSTRWGLRSGDQLELRRGEVKPPSDHPQGKGRLVLVATPIGNLGDLSPRAVRTLEASDMVCCEDTRRTRELLSHAGDTHKRMLSLNEHNEAERIPGVLARVRIGELVAVVSDAGTPGVSDPGGRLVAAAVGRGTLGRGRAGCERRTRPL